VCVCVWCVCVLRVCVVCVCCVCACVFLFNLLLLHAPLHYVILHARFALIHVYMISSCDGFLFLVVWAFVSRPCSLQFFEIYGVCEHCKLFEIFVH